MGNGSAFKDHYALDYGYRYAGRCNIRSRQQSGNDSESSKAKGEGVQLTSLYKVVGRFSFWI